MGPTRGITPYSYLIKLYGEKKINTRRIIDILGSLGRRIRTYKNNMCKRGWDDNIIPRRTVFPTTTAGKHYETRDGYIWGVIFGMRARRRWSTTLPYD